MCESALEFNERPFAAMPLASRYYPAAAIEDARKRLVRCIERGEGVGLVMGPAGTGKSLLCQVLAEHFRDTCSVVHLANGRFCTRRALLQTILFELQLPYRQLDEGELRLSLIDEFTRKEPSQDALLLVDEAHTIPLKLFEEIRMMTNLTRQGSPCVRLVLAGSSQLEEQFSSPQLDCFNQRVTARCYLEALDQHDIFEYIRNQLRWCGGNPDELMTDDALQAVYRATNGIPRLVNQLCNHALVMAAAGGKEQLLGEVVEEAWADLQQLPAPPAAPASSAEEGTADTVIEFGGWNDDLNDPKPPTATSSDVLSATLPVQEVAPKALPSATSTVKPRDKQEPLQESPTSCDTPSCDTPQESPADPITHPFLDRFAEEEMVIDPYTSFGQQELNPGPPVAGSQDQGLAALRNTQASVVGRRPSLSSKQDPVRKGNTPTPIGSTFSEPVDMPFNAQNDPVMPEDELPGIVPLKPSARHLPECASFADTPPVCGSTTDLPDPGEDDLLLIEDEPTDCKSPPVSSVAPHDFGNVFSKLRQLD